MVVSAACQVPTYRRHGENARWSREEARGLQLCLGYSSPYSDLWDTISRRRMRLGL